MGHIGLTPQSVHQMGGFVVQGRDEEQAQASCSTTRRRSRTRAATRWCSRASRSSWRGTSPRRCASPPSASAPASHCDGQVLVCYDLLGLNPDFKPKFVKRFADWLRRARAARPSTFFAEVHERRLPGRRALASTRQDAAPAARPAARRRRRSATSREDRPGLRRAGLMRVVPRASAELRGVDRAARRAGPARSALVPTMGFLHAGHLSLMREARRERADVGRGRASSSTRPSSGPNEDLARYPRDLEGDLAKCRAARRGRGVRAGARARCIRPGHQTCVEVTGLQDGLCGARRPGHFRGVATVVTQLFALARPARGGVRREGLAAAADSSAGWRWTSTSAWRWWACPSSASRTGWR